MGSRGVHVGPTRGDYLKESSRKNKVIENLSNWRGERM